MQITRLRVSGFKSFSDPVELDIADGLTGVVGPNGCGKSNIVEALRWVMGESSARGLRGGEMDDIIFNGSSLRPAHDLAEVCLTLHGDLSVFGRDGQSGEVQISRRIGRGTGSVFRVNGKEARSRDVQTAFADVSSGSRSAAMVGQGQITFIVEAKAEERRRLLEDAAGIGGMHARRREAELKLEATEANLVRVSDRLAEQQLRHGELEKQNQQAKRYIKLQSEIRQLDAILHLTRLHAAAEALAGAEEAHGAAESDDQQAQNALDEARGRRAELDRRIAACRTERQTHAEHWARLKERADRLAGERALHESRLRELDDNHEALEREAADIQTRAGQGRQALERLSHELEAWRQERAPLPGTIEDRQRQSEADGRDLEALSRTSQELTETRAQLRAACQALRDRRGSEQERAAGLERTLATITSRLAAMTDAPPVSAGEDETALAEPTARLEAAKSQRRALIDDAAAVRTEHEERGRDHVELGDAYRALDLRCRDTEAEKKRLDDRWRELATQRDRMQARRRQIEADLERTEQRLRELDVEGLAARLQAAQDTRHGLEARQEAAVTNEHQARDALVGAQEQMESLKAGLATLEAEQAALEPMLSFEGRQPVWRDLAIEPGCEGALAAALGDDLLADHDNSAASYWSMFDKQALPSLPQGVTALDRKVQGSAKLEARLSQVGIAEDAARALTLQAKLAPGQRLVTREGGLWRWDGFVRSKDAADPGAARIRQHQRWAVLVDEVEAARTTLAQATAACEARRDAHQKAAQARATLAKELDQASRALDGLDRSHEAAARESAFLGKRRDELEPERRTLSADLEGLETECREGRERLIALGDPAQQRMALDAARRRWREAGEQTEALAKRLKELEQARDRIDHDIEARAQALDQARTELAAAQRRRDEDRRRVQAEREGLLRQQTETGKTLEELKRALLTLEPEIAATADRLARTEARHEESQREVQSRQDQQSDNLRRLAEAQQRLAELGIKEEQGQRDLLRIGHELAELDARATAVAARRQHYAEALDEARAAAGDGDQAARLEGELADAEAALQALDQALETEIDAQKGLEAEIDALEATIVRARERMASYAREIERARGERDAVRSEVMERLERMTPELREELDKMEMPDAAQAEALAERLRRASASRDRLGAVNLRAAEEVAAIEAEIARTQAKEAELRAAVERLKRAIGTLNSEARQRLQAVFGTVDDHFRKLFTRLFGGGRAHLRLVNMDDPLRAGLELDAMPPGKKLQNIGLLSGGEKSMTALALVFALFLTRPSPLCVLDEVDAALDDSNVDRFLLLMEEIARDTGTRFLVVTHHPLTMARMNRLYGVTMMEQGVSRLVSVALEQAVEMRAA